ncbi:hypothetical protein XENTR_v10017134 [Xenopus tropicalis]|nr:hypothetical protein XENTR_v10017134 [Xenopus tropicalis]
MSACSPEITVKCRSKTSALLNRLLGMQRLIFKLNTWSRIVFHAGYFVWVIHHTFMQPDTEREYATIPNKEHLHEK